MINRIMMMIKTTKGSIDLREIRRVIKDIE